MARLGGPLPATRVQWGYRRFLRRHHLGDHCSGVRGSAGPERTGRFRRQRCRRGWLAGWLRYGRPWCRLFSSRPAGPGFAGWSHGGTGAPGMPTIPTTITVLPDLPGPGPFSRPDPRRDVRYGSCRRARRGAQWSGQSPSSDRRGPAGWRPRRSRHWIQGRRTDERSTAGRV